MVELALSIIAFIFVAYFFVIIGLGGLGLTVGLIDSVSSNDNKAKRRLDPVMRILGLNENETIRSNTPEEVIREAISVYYVILKKVFESETPEERKEVYSSNTPSGRLSNAFFALTGLGKSLNILTNDINYVMEGGGWSEHKKLLKIATGGTLKKSDSEKYEIAFNKKFHLTIEEHISNYDVYDREKEWRIEGFYNKNEVLSCYAPRSNDTAYTFKPGAWILDILKSAEKYSLLINEMELKNATERREEQLFA